MGSCVKSLICLFNKKKVMKLLTPNSQPTPPTSVVLSLVLKSFKMFAAVDTLHYVGTVVPKANTKFYSLK